jgi:hypothetical protein
MPPSVWPPAGVPTPPVYYPPDEPGEIWPPAGIPSPPIAVAPPGIWPPPPAPPGYVVVWVPRYGWHYFKIGVSVGGGPADGPAAQPRR